MFDDFHLTSVGWGQRNTSCQHGFNRRNAEVLHLGRSCFPSACHAGGVPKKLRFSEMVQHCGPFRIYDELYGKPRR